MQGRVLGDTYAPLYCATSSPSTKTLSFDSSSSASASFNASRTATSLTPLGVAYFLRASLAGNDMADWKAGLVEAVRGLERREAGRSKRETTMTEKEEVELSSEVRIGVIGIRFVQEEDVQCAVSCVLTEM